MTPVPCAGAQRFTTALGNRVVRSHAPQQRPPLSPGKPSTLAHVHQKICGEVHHGPKLEPTTLTQFWNILWQ